MNSFVAKDYDNAERFDVYKTQAKLIEELEPISSILEIGIGSGFMKRYLRSKGKIVFSLDINEELLPDVVCDVSKGFELNESFDLVTCFQVLEYVSVFDLKGTLQSIRRHGDKFVFSVPINSWFFILKFKFPFMSKEWAKVLWLPKNRVEPRNNRVWEVGEKSCSLGCFKRILEDNQFRVIKFGVFASDPLHAYFVCEASK